VLDVGGRAAVPDEQHGDGGGQDHHDRHDHRRLHGFGESDREGVLGRSVQLGGQVGREVRREMAGDLSAPSRAQQLLELADERHLQEAGEDRGRQERVLQGPPDRTVA